MSVFDSKYVKCPFYRTNDQNRVCCDGIADGCTTNVVFGDPKRRKSFMSCFCNDIIGFKRCPIYQALRERCDGDGE